MGLRCHQTKIAYKCLASIFCMQSLKNLQNGRIWQFASTGVSLRQPDMNETYIELSLVW